MIRLGWALLGVGVFWGGAASAQTNVTFAAYSGMFQDRYTDAVLKPFEAANPDVKITYFPMGTSAQMMGTIRAQKNGPQIDVVIMDVSVSKAGTDEGLFDPVDEKVAPNVAQLVPQARISGVAGVAVTFDNLVLVYDSQTVKTAPSSWMALADPSVAGRTAIEAPPNIVGVALTVILNQMNGGTDYLKSTAAGITAMEKIAPGVETWEPQPEVYPLVANGTVAMATGWNARGQSFSDQSGGRLRAVLPKEGSVLQINTINLVKGGPQEAAARRFVNYALGTTAQASFTKAMYYAPTNGEAKIPDNVAARTAVHDLDKMIPVDWVAMAQVRDGITQAWRRQVIPLSH